MNGKIGNFFFTLLFSFAFVLAFENIYQSICSFIESVVVTARFEFRVIIFLIISHQFLQLGDLQVRNPD
jgi:hypothetical protein